MTNEFSEVHINNYPFLCGRSVGDAESNPAYAAIRDATATFMESLQRDRICGLMAELAIFSGLCATHLQHRDRTPIILLPKGKWEFLNYVPWEVDCQLIVAGENRPIDVSNSMQHTMESYPKILEHEQWERDGRLEPVLVNRMSSKLVKDYYRNEWNSMVCDFEKLILLDDETTRELHDAARILEIHDHIYWIPPLATGHGNLDGASYDQVVASTRPEPEGFAPCADQLPLRLRHKITGLYRLAYVNSLYRQAHTTRERVVSLVIQKAYSYLLRADDWRDEPVVVDYAIPRLPFVYRSAFDRDANYYRDEVSERLANLHGTEFLQRLGGRLRIPDAVHPETYFK